MLFPVYKMQYNLRRLLRAIQCLSTAALVIFIIHVYFIRSGTQSDGASIKNNATTLVPSRMVCLSNTFATRKGCMPCPQGTFSFPDWSKCTPWLNCSQIALQVHPTTRILRGATKLLWRAEWKGHQVVFVNCTPIETNRGGRCARGISIIERIQGEFATRLIGTCPDKLQVSLSRCSDFQ